MTATPPVRRSRLTARQVAGVVLTLLTAVFLIQNRREVSIRLIVPTVRMPLWLALLLMLAVGFALGWLLQSRRRRRG